MGGKSHQRPYTLASLHQSLEPIAPHLFKRAYKRKIALLSCFDPVSLNLKYPTKHILHRRMQCIGGMFRTPIVQPRFNLIVKHSHVLAGELVKASGDNIVLGKAKAQLSGPRKLHTPVDNYGRPPECCYHSARAPSIDPAFGTGLFLLENRWVIKNLRPRIRNI